VARLEEAYANSEATMDGGCIGEDPGLDQFMEAYCEMLTKYEQELSKPFKEAMLFFSRIDCQLKALTLSSSDSGGDILKSSFVLHLSMEVGLAFHGKRKCIQLESFCLEARGEGYWMANIDICRFDSLRFVCVQAWIFPNFQPF
jgi:hypothetical protein